MLSWPEMIKTRRRDQFGEGKNKKTRPHAEANDHVSFL